MFEELHADVRYAVRSIGHNPLFAAVVVATLALGIGGNTAIFSALQSVLLRPFRHANADRIVMVWRQARTGALMISPSAELAEVWAERQTTFEWLHPMRVGNEVTLTGGREAVVLTSGTIPTALFNDLGAQTQLGRFFEEADDDRSVVLSHGYWKSQYGGANVIGQTIALDGTMYAIIGVASPGFEVPAPYTNSPDVWMPYVRKGSQGTHVLGMLRPAATIDGARDELASIMTQFGEDHPNYRDWGPVIVRPQEMIASGTGQTLWMLFSAVGLVLLIACLNVANILIARAKSRQQEFAVRAALGASRARLLRLVMIESILLAIVGGAMGLFLAVWAIDAIVALRPDRLQSLDRIAIDGTVLWFTFGTSITVGLLLGFLPAFHGTTGDAGVLLRSGRGLTQRGHRLRSTLVTAEVALSMALLVTTTLIVRSMLELQRADPGFRSVGLLTGRVNLPSWKYESEAARLQYYASLQGALAGTPGVAAVTRAGGLPPEVSVSFGQLEIEGIDGVVESGIVLPGANTRADYFEVLRQPLLEGRSFTVDEVEGDAPAYVVNEAFARRYFPDGSAVGSRIRLSETAPWHTIVGTAGNVRAGGLANEPNRPMLYKPSPNTGSFTRYIVRTSVDPSTLVPTIRRRVAAIDPDVPVRDLTTVSDLLSRSISRQRFAMTLLVLFAATAISLVAVGIYGVLSQIVVQRTREIGIRVALGASIGRVRRLIVSQAIAMTGAGLLLGVGLALFASRFVESQLFGITTRDALSFSAAAVVIVAASFLGAFFPARRATGVDPVEAIRAE